MVPVNQIELAFGDGSYLFRLRLKEINELQKLCNAGIGAIFARVIKGRYIAKDGEASFGFPQEAEYRAEDLNHTIRLGLVGGGEGVVDGMPVEVTATRATELCAAYVDGTPYSERWNLAAAILTACIEGYQPKEAVPDTPKKPRPARTKGSSTSPEH